MKKKTILVAAIAVMLVAALVVGGTLAYFTDTDAAKNTFTVGNVKIDLIEEGGTSRDGFIEALFNVKVKAVKGAVSKAVVGSGEVVIG